MITIEPHYNNFNMKFSNPGSGQKGFVVIAKNIGEIHTAINHYYAVSVQSGGHVNGTNDDCPLCRTMEK